MRKVTILVVSAMLYGCASTELENDAPSAAIEAVDAPTALPPIESAVLLAAEKLKAHLASLGYEAIGLEFETEEVLAFLDTVFRDPNCADRQIRTIYTGAQNSYDVASQSLTLWTSQDPKLALGFIKKTIPTRKKKQRSRR